MHSKLTGKASPELHQKTLTPNIRQILKNNTNWKRGILLSKQILLHPVGRMSFIPLCHCTWEPIDIQHEETFVRLSYLLGGGREYLNRANHFEYWYSIKFYFVSIAKLLRLNAFRYSNLTKKFIVCTSVAAT